MDSNRINDNRFNDSAIDDLARFCAEQYYTFNADDWLRSAEANERLPLVLARYLAGTSWYGHTESLERIGALAEGADAADYPLDIGRFSAAIRLHIALKRVQGNTVEPNEDD